MPKSKTTAQPAERTKPRGRNVLVLDAGTEAEKEAAVANAFTSPHLSGGLIVSVYHSTGTDIAPEFGATMEALRSHQQKVKAGDMSLAESMLINQAVALQAMFTQLAINAKAQTRLPHLVAITGLALRAQAGSRAALQALGELKYPRQVVFAKQVNNASGPQQVLNGTTGLTSENYARAKKTGNQENELLEDGRDGSTYLDAGATSTPARGNPTMAAVEQVHRPSKPRRQSRSG